MFEDRAQDTASCVREVLDTAVNEPPNAELLARLTRLDPARLGRDELVDLVAGLERHAGWLAGCQQQALAALAEASARADSGRGGEFVAEEVSAALGVSARTAQTRLEVARTLIRRLPLTLELLTIGRIGYWHAVAVCDEVWGLPAGPDTERVVAGVEARIAARAGHIAIGQLRRLVRREINRAMPGWAATRREKAVHERGVSLVPLEDGMAALTAQLAAEDALVGWRVLDQLAGPPTGDGRGIAARRADAFTDLFRHALEPGSAASACTPTSARAPGEPEQQAASQHCRNAAPASDDAAAGGDGPAGGQGAPGDDAPRSARRPDRPRALMEVVIGVDSLFGLTAEPAELMGYGPIPAQVARSLAADGQWRRLVTEPVSGFLLDYGRTTYRPPAELARYLRARDRTCRFPTCSQPARRTDLDHAQPWRAGGATSATNLGVVCRRHHRAKTVGGWRLDRFPDATASWTSPTGRAYDTQPHDHPGTGPGGWAYVDSSGPAVGCGPLPMPDREDDPQAESLQALLDSLKPEPPPTSAPRPDVDLGPPPFWRRARSGQCLGPRGG